MKNFSLLIFFWFVSLLGVSYYTYENPERVEIIKDYFKKQKKPEVKIDKKEINRVPANSFIVEFSKEISLNKKTAFVYHDEVSNFDIKSLKVFYQNGYITKNKIPKKINLPKTFTTTKNGGIKNIFIYKKNEFALISSFKEDCYYASIILIKDGLEVFKTKCLPSKNIDYNGLGSSHVHSENKVFISIGTPEQSSSVIASLAQDKNSFFGKIISINKKDLDDIILKKSKSLKASIFTSGHRNPQGFTKLNNSFFSVEHGPRGGDELNKIIEGRNYGWPKVSYGTKYSYDENAKAYEVSHENNNFEEPLFALVPSVGISALNNCPLKLKEYYKKPCLLALSLYGNSQRPGRSIIIYLLNNKMNKIHSIEKIFLRDDLKFRHFVTNKHNELFEDKDGNIYVSADMKGIYKLSFVDFRN
jgi:hypothetical protein